MILAVVLVANGMGSEYSWNTLRPYLLCSESRLKMFTAKLIAAAIFIVAGMIIGLIIAVLLGAFFTAIRGFSWDLGSQHGEFYRARIVDFCSYLVRHVTLYTAGFSFYGFRAVNGSRDRVWYRGVRFRVYYHRIDINGTRLAGKNTELLAHPQYPED